VATDISLDLQADAIAVALSAPCPASSDGASSEGYVPCKGYLDVARDGMHRLYRDATGLSWLEVEADDIAYRVHVPETDLGPCSVLWIRRKALVNNCHRAEAHELENEVWGLDPGGGPNKKSPPF
jgi:hypothetical protein